MGIATIGSAGDVIAGISILSGYSNLIVKSSKPSVVVIPSASASATPVAVSFGVPPPNETMPSASMARAASAARTTELRGTCWTVSANTSAMRPPLALRTRSTRSVEFSRVLPVINSARDTPSRSSVSPSPSMLPGPYATSSKGSIVKLPDSSRFSNSNSTPNSFQWLTADTGKRTGRSGSYTIVSSPATSF